MNHWNNYLNKIQAHLSRLEKEGCDLPFFRGHKNSNWKLLSGLGRQPLENYKKIKHTKKTSKVVRLFSGFGLHDNNH